MSQTKPISQGPLPGYFAICPELQNCVVLDQKNKNTQVFKTSTVVSPNAFSSQYLKKTLITGFPTQILDFSASGTKPVVKSTIDSEILLDCVFTKSKNWICVSGRGHYLSWDVASESPIIRYNSCANKCLSQVTNSRCTEVENGKKLLCAKIDDTYMQIFDLNNSNSLFREYYGKL